MTYIKQNLRTKRDECFTNINGVEFYYFKNGNNYSFHKVIDNILGTVCMINLADF